MKDFLIEHDLGFTLDPNDPVQLANKLIELDAKQDQLSEMGQRAMTLAAKEFDKDFLASKMLDEIQKSIQ